MPEHDVEHFGRTAAVQARADRRRRRRYAGSAALGVMLAAVFGVGVAFGQSKHSPEPPTISTVPTIPPSTLRTYAPGEPIKAPPPEYSPAGEPTVAPMTTDPAPSTLRSEGSDPAPPALVTGAPDPAPPPPLTGAADPVDR
jgi:hypothetical protein